MPTGLAPRVLLIVPTLGRRMDFLEQTLMSIRDQSVPADIVGVVPTTALPARELLSRFGARILDDPGSLPGAVNLGAAQLTDAHAYLNWIGDDDLLEPEALRRTTEALDADPDATVAFGSCRYIDDTGGTLWVNRVGRLAPHVLSWGPDLVPQPGMLVRASAWRAVGGVDEQLSMAFDLDLLLKLRALGPFASVGAVVSSFRWHADSLTTANRDRNLDETELVRRRHLSPAARRMAWVWERPVRGLTRMAVHAVNRRARRHVEAMRRVGAP